MFKIFPILALKDNYIWCIVHPNSSECVIIDPGEAKPVIETLEREKLKLQGILVTHHHWDHTNGIAEIIQNYPVPVYGPGKKLDSVENKILKEGDILTIPQMGLQISTLSIPGHTLDHVAFLIKDGLFTGDTLFTGGCGRVFEGTMAQLLKALDKLCDFGDETLIYCGHEYTANNLEFAKKVEPNNLLLQRRIQQTLKDRANDYPTVPSTLYLEKQTNPFLRVDDPEVKVSVETYAGTSLPDREAVFTALREWKNKS